MTLIIGYIDQNTAQIIADSAMTYENEFTPLFNVHDEEVTSFGEAVVITDDVTVVESGQKIAQFSRNAVGTFSGFGTEGFNTFSDLKMILRAASGASRLLSITNLFSTKRAGKHRLYHCFPRIAMKIGYQRSDVEGFVAFIPAILKACFDGLLRGRRV